tara:strand:- start:560 stop:2902 length:2343 start_codon:yes stop_codon:yes gene_type:complete
MQNREEGKVELGDGKERLKDVQKLRSINWQLADDDRTSERNRAKVQDLKDHKPPLNAKMLERSGQKGRHNINFGDLARAIGEAESSYIDGFESPEHLVPIKLNRGVFSPELQTQYERTMSDEHTKLIRGWDGGFFNYALMVQQFLLQGVGIGFFEDKYTWQWKGAGLREFKFPRKTKAHADAVEMCICEGQMGRSRLADILEDEEAAKLMGWNPKAIKVALAGEDDDELYDEDNEEDSQEKSKANDFDDEAGSFHPINLVYAWVRENNGSVSYYIATKYAKANNTEEKEDVFDDYLYKKLNAYDSFGESLQIFPYSTGTKGNIYTIRGIGFELYPQIMAKNKLQSGELDAVALGQSLKISAPAEREISSMPFINAGAVTIIPPHMNIMKDQYAPDLSKVSGPALDRLEQQLSAKSAASSMSSVFQNKQDRRSSQEVGGAIDHFSQLEGGSKQLFARPWRAMMCESAIRAYAEVIDETTDYGAMAMVMQKACIDQGVPPEAFSQIDPHETKTSIPVGAGSKAARTAEFENGATLYQEMDDIGRENYNKDRAIHGFGVVNAKRYLNFEGVPREHQDVRNALFENNDLMTGQWLDPSNSEVHIIHLREHLKPMEEAIEGVEKGEMELIDFTNQMELVFNHALQTIQLAVVPEQQNDELSMYEQKLQQIGEYLNNGIREREKMQREQQEQQAQEQAQGAQGEQGDPAAAAKMEAEQIKIESAREQAAISIERKKTENQLDAEKQARAIAHIDMLHEQKMVQNQAEALQKEALKDTETASKIKRS